MAADERNQRRVLEITKSASDAHQRLREKYGVADNDLIERDIRQAYVKGLHSAISDQVLAYLANKHGSQTRIASVLGVDRSTISKMKRNHSVPGQYINLVLASNGFAIQSNSAQRSGLIAATYYVRSKVIKDKLCSGPMSDAEFTELACGKETEWFEAFLLALMEVEDFVQG
jgi:hypothetical protein